MMLFILILLLFLAADVVVVVVDTDAVTDSDTADVAADVVSMPHPST